MTKLIVPVTTASDLLSYIKQDADTRGNLSIRGVARMATVNDTAIIRGAEFTSQKLAEKLTAHGFESAELSSNGFPPQAVILVLEYFAYESKAKAEGAKQLMRTFGTIGLMSVLNQLKPSEPVKEVKVLPQRDTIDYIEAAKAIPTLKVNPQLRQLLEDALTDELELMRNQKLIGGKAEHTVVKVRAKELGYTTEQIKNGSGLGRHVASVLEPSFTMRVGDYMVNHYQVSDRLDEAIHAYFR